MDKKEPWRFLLHSIKVWNAPLRGLPDDCAMVAYYGSESACIRSAPLSKTSRPSASPTTG